MTNKEALIMAINDEFDDWGVSESLIYHHIACPYSYRDKRCKCNDTEPDWDICSECKQEWLEAEVDG